MYQSLSSFQSPLDLRGWISTFLFLFIFGSTALSQSAADVRANQKKLKAEISLTQKHLTKLNKDKSIGLFKYNSLQKQLKSRAALMLVYERELDMVAADLVAQEADITLLKEQYDVQKSIFKASTKEYHRIRTTWHPLAFILSSSDLTTAWNRLTFYQSLSKHHRSQIEKLKKKEFGLLARLDKLKKTQLEREQRLLDLADEKAQIEINKKARQAEITRLKKNEGFLQKRLKSQETQSAKLSSLLQNLVADNIKKRSTSNELPSEAKKLNAAFGANKGKLPWPVSNGYIGRKFGKQRHPELTMIYITNNGIDIITDEGEEVLAVFDGKVTAVQKVAGFQRTILVNHGSFYTVYANVENVGVSPGESIKRGQSIAYTASSESGSSLHFELWKGRTLQNPSLWLKAK